MEKGTSLPGSVKTPRIKHAGNRGRNQQTGCAAKKPQKQSFDHELADDLPTPAPMA